MPLQKLSLEGKKRLSSFAMGIRQPIDDHIKFNVYNIFVNPNKAMYKILKTIILHFLSNTHAKRLVIQILRSFVKQSSNTVDDKLVDLLEQNLFPKLN